MHVNEYQFLLYNWTKASFRCSDCIKNQLITLETETGSRFSLKDEMDNILSHVSAQAPQQTQLTHPLPHPTIPSPSQPREANRMSSSEHSNPQLIPSPSTSTSFPAANPYPLVQENPEIPDTEPSNGNSSEDIINQNNEIANENTLLNESSSSEESFTSSHDETIMPVNDDEEEGELANEQTSERTPQNREGELSNEQTGELTPQNSELLETEIVKRQQESG